MQKKIVVSLLAVATSLLVTNIQAGTVTWSDPLPNTAAVKAVAATDTTPAVAAKPSTGGIGYEWTVTLGADDAVDFVGSVGAKSAYEPTFTAPNFAWQHTSNYVALDLTADTKVTFTVERQMGVTTASVDKATGAIVVKDAANKLNPALIVWKNWEESGVETGSFNPLGKTDWMNELVWIGIAYTDKGQSTVTTSLQLPKGHYTVNIAAANGYGPNGCAATDTVCYATSQGYHAKISTTSK